MSSPDPSDTIQTLRWNLHSLGGGAEERRAPGDVRALVRAVKELPPLPQVTEKLLALTHDPDADAAALAAIVEMDPLLSAQILRSANSAYYGVRQPVESVRAAVSRVLGFEPALHLSLGWSALNPLNTPRSGVLGHAAVWRHGMTCARLMVALRAQMPDGDRPSAGTAQLAGLIQNIGYLLLGHLLPTQFGFLSRLVERNGAIELPVIEDFALGLNHAQLGEWLLDAWGLPTPLCRVVRHHHNPNYGGDGERLVWLCALADRLLAETPAGLGVAASEEILAALAERLSLRLGPCRALAAEVLEF
jgi:HD-like signal output (HDOD) protein